MEREFMRMPIYEPTPAEIERACEEIQRQWDDEERLRRIVGARSEAPRAPAAEAVFLDNDPFALPAASQQRRAHYQSAES